MTKAFKFNPGFLTDEEAIAGFVVRRPQLEAVLQVFDAAVGSARVLVVAPRGAGKTTLCRRVLVETRAEGRLGGNWHAIFLGEESYVVTTPGEFFLECLFHLRDQTPGAVPEARYQAAVAAADEDELIAATMAALRDFVVIHGKRLLIVVENFHIILQDQIGSAAARLLTLLADDALFGVLATSVAQGRIEGDNRDIIPADFVRVRLEPLTLQECQTLWEAITEQSVRSERIRPLEILTGGSPRLLHILAEFMRTPSLQDLMVNLNQLIDQNTEYFKSQLDALPPMERKVFAALLDAWDPQSAKQIAEQARVSTNAASTMLGRLSDRGAVIRGPAEGRAAIYYAAERLFNIYYLMRRRSHPSNRVRALVSFMTGYYDQDELVKTTALLVREACALDPELRGDHHSTFHAILSGAPESTRKQILDQTPRDFIRDFRRDRSLLRVEEPDLFGAQSSVTDEEAEIARLIDTFEAAADGGDFAGGLRILQDMLDRWPDLAGAWIRISLVHQRLEAFEDAVAPAQKAVELAPDDAWAKAVLARALLGIGEPAQAAELFKQSLDRNPAQVMAAVGLAELKQNDGDIDAAIAIYERARAAGPMPDLLWSRFGMLLAEANRSEEAEEVLKAALDAGADNIGSRSLLVDVLNRSGRDDEAMELLETAASQFDGPMHWAELGMFLYAQTDRIDEARIALEASVARGLNRVRPFRVLAQSLLHTDTPVEKLKSLVATAVDQVSSKAQAWDFAGDVFWLIEDSAAAEKAYRTSIQVEDNVSARIGLARILALKVETQSEAEALLRETLEDPRNKEVCGAARELAELLVHQGDEDEAEKIVNETLQANEECICCLLMRGQICARRGDREAAAKSFDAALKLDDESVTALTGLALADPERAENLITRAMSLSPGNAGALFARAKLLHQESPDAQISDLLTAVEKDPGFIPAVLMLAPLEAERGDRHSAIQRLSLALDSLPGQREWLSDLVTAAMTVAHLSDAEEVLALVENHEAAVTLEPLIVALRLLNGETPRVAKEVFEVAKDIVERTSRRPDA